jgi:hypothetical protein
VLKNQGQFGGSGDLVIAVIPEIGTLAIGTFKDQFMPEYLLE